MTESDDIWFVKLPFGEPPDEEDLQATLEFIEKVGEVDWPSPHYQIEAFRTALLYARAVFSEESQHEECIERKIIFALARVGPPTLDLVTKDCYNGFVKPDPS